MVRRCCCRAREPARQRVEADLGEGDGPITLQIAMTAEPDAAAAAGGAVAAAVEQEKKENLAKAMQPSCAILRSCALVGLRNCACVAVPCQRLAGALPGEKRQTARPRSSESGEAFTAPAL